MRTWTSTLLISGAKCCATELVEYGDVFSASIVLFSGNWQNADCRPVLISVLHWPLCDYWDLQSWSTNSASLAFIPSHLHSFIKSCQYSSSIALR